MHGDSRPCWAYKCRRVAGHAFAEAKSLGRNRVISAARLNHHFFMNVTVVDSVPETRDAEASSDHGLENPRFNQDLRERSAFQYSRISIFICRLALGVTVLCWGALCFVPGAFVVAFCHGLVFNACRCFATRVLRDGHLGLASEAGACRCFATLGHID